MYCSGLVGQYCDVVLVGGAFSSGKPQGVGISEWGGGETGRSVYEQPGTRVDGSYHSKEGSK
jgi:hypothetical protein